eukprot:Protomagalhaensia_wolfi_Nauph_80__3883@NODE_3935_length_676_cov_507_700157_g3116_i0_p1_GENE_NODE_3935_length_676_cov_507_700157_g3116_i0NODE_3935_length_676_cov_507_700157_g3116_i0_p1_ORF_typecomplete_len117_score11_35_NODE_3935_length_676_cov_507_700157_g3116_i086436
MCVFLNSQKKQASHLVCVTFFLLFATNIMHPTGRGEFGHGGGGPGCGGFNHPNRGPGFGGVGPGFGGVQEDTVLVGGLLHQVLFIGVLVMAPGYYYGPPYYYRPSLLERIIGPRYY